ncbi:peritrophin-48-like [Nylanderia fulva]|uniref:peritrophin-48-like n=1 Tax=Nylanderia fulva TaxID=613905 RepID=UPI0010FB51D6|nr:peritrophin-48-like [Nylanderia fulva]
MERFSIILLCLLCFGALKVIEAQDTTKYNCTEVGFFEIVDGTCRNYYMCIDDGQQLTPVMLSCANSAIFDPDQGKCVPKNSTTCEQTPLCTRYGRFPIQDVYCKMYYLCYWNGTSYTIMGNLSCPKTLVFQPTSEKCVLPEKYVCSGIQSNYANASMQSA